MNEIESLRAKLAERDKAIAVLSKTLESVTASIERIIPDVEALRRQARPPVPAVEKITALVPIVMEQEDKAAAALARLAEAEVMVDDLRRLAARRGIRL